MKRFEDRRLELYAFVRVFLCHFPQTATCAQIKVSHEFAVVTLLPLQVSKRFMDKTQKERILYALQRLERHVGKVS